MDAYKTENQWLPEQLYNIENAALMRLISILLTKF